MVNSQIVQEIVNGLKLDSRIDKIPSIQPVFITNMKLVKNMEVAGTTRSISGTLTGITTPTNQDFYLLGFDYDMIKDSACDLATGPLYIYIYQNGNQKPIYVCPTITLTAQTQNKSIMFNHPIKIDKGTAITTNATFTAGTLIRTLNLYYFIDEVN